MPNMKKQRKLSGKPVKNEENSIVAKESVSLDPDALLASESNTDSGFGDECIMTSSVHDSAVAELHYPSETQKKHEDAIRFLKGAMEKIKAYSTFLFERIQEDADKVKIAPVITIKKRKLVGNVKNFEDQPLLFTNIGLRDHQIEGFKWLKTLYENGLNGILADEMGLGKTAIAIGMISHLISMGVDGPFMVCAPLSTLHNWCKETTRFAPEVPYIMYHGSKQEREDLRSKMLKPVPVRNHKCTPVIITSFDTIVHDFKYIRSHTWRYVVVDEGHRLKNYDSKLFQIIKSLNIENILLLTGTPLQNNLGELWALLNIVLPQVFNDLNAFKNLIDTVMLSSEDAEKIIVSEEERNHLISSIHQILTLFLLRRTKKDINLFIPPKKEILVYAPMTELQRLYYCAIIDNTIEDVLNEEKSHVINNTDRDDLLLKDLTSNSGKRPSRKKRKLNYAELEENDLETPASKTVSETESKKSRSEKSIVNLKMSNVSMMLRKVCQHPYLLSFPLNPKTKELLINEKLVKTSGKMRVLDVMLPELQKRGHKVLIFSQFVIMLEIIADYCEMRKFKFCMLTGTTKLSDRIEEIEEFNNTKTSFVFLLSTRAGGLGVNLTAADTVIIFDSDWNPQCDLQAQDRCHRLGQEKPVVVYRLCTESTIDQEIIQRAAAKRKLEKLIIKEGCFATNDDTFTKSQKPVSPEELISLINSSDIKASVRCESSTVFTKKELNFLLDRSDIESGNEKSKPIPHEIAGVFKVIS